MLSWEDNWAIREDIDISDERFSEAKNDLLLLLRQKRLRGFGQVSLVDERSSYSFEPSFQEFHDYDWKHFVNKYRDQLSESEDGSVTLGQLVPLPPEIWHRFRIDWNRSFMECKEGPIQAVVPGLSVATAELLYEFTPDQEAISVSLEDVEKKSLLKLVAAMSIKGYRYSPNSQRNVATADIESDLLALGLSLDRKTILKWLREAANSLPDDFEK